MSNENNPLERYIGPSGGVLGCHLSANQILREEGWEWRLNAEGPKLRQAVESYAELGFEVRLERIDLSGLSEACAGCRGTLELSSAVFVRQKR